MTDKGIRLVASLELVKGFLALILFVSLFFLFHEESVQHALRSVLAWIGGLNGITPKKVLALVALYTSIRFVEGSGLWFEKQWAKWLGAVSGSIYIPWEIEALHGCFSVTKLGLFLVNATIVLYLIWNLQRTRHTKAHLHSIAR